MFKYVCKRILYALFTVFIISVITFSVMNLVPGGPFMSEKAVSPATQAALEAKYGLDASLPEQYFNYMGGVLQGDFGVSLKQIGRTANDIIFSTFPVSARVGGLAIIVAIVGGTFLGSIAATQHGKIGDQSIMLISTLGNAVPSFVVATVLVLFFGNILKIFPTIGLDTPAHYVLPVATLAFYPMAYITRLTRSSMLDALSQDYMRTARAKGVSRTKMVFKHALRNAILPVITYVGPLLAYTVVGSFVVEKIFNIPGLGREFINCIQARDYPMIMSTTLFLAMLLIGMNVIVDIVYKIIDPRIKLN